MGMSLARARHAGTLSDINPSRITSLREAQEVQTAALTCFGGMGVGYSMAATSPSVARLLDHGEAIISRMLDTEMLDSGALYRIPRGTIGLGAQIIVTIGAPIREPMTLRSVADSIVMFRAGFQILGRRVASRHALNRWTATGDFGLNAACVLGSQMDESSLRKPGSPFLIGMNGNVLQEANLVGLAGDPVAAVLYLARYLKAYDVPLQACDLVAVGAFTHLLQAIPGQTVELRAGASKLVSVRLT